MFILLSKDSDTVGIHSVTASFWVRGIHQSYLRADEWRQLVERQTSVTTKHQ